MANSTTNNSPSRSSLNCCQIDNTSENNVNEICHLNVEETSINNNYFNSTTTSKEKYSFPKRPEIDLSFRNIRYRVRTWNTRKFKLGKFFFFFFFTKSENNSFT